MLGNPTTVAGISIPSDAPLFLASFAMRAAAGPAAVMAGAFAMLSRKRPGRHPQAGTVYYWALAVVFVTMSALAFSRWNEDYHLFILGLLSFVAATIGRTARRQLGPSWPRTHMTGMAASYILMITAFYVDNGPNLPLWRELPPAGLLDSVNAHTRTDPRPSAASSPACEADGQTVADAGRF
jgi:hypothetical protein